jgi:membrane protein
MLYGVPWRRFFRELYQEINEDDVFNGAAALGFWLTLAIFPAMIFMMAVIPYLPFERVDQEIMSLLQRALPQNAAAMFAGVVQEVTREQRGGVLSFGFLATLWAASAGMYAIMQQLNITYDVKEGRSFLRARSIAIGLSALFAVLVIGAFSLVVLGAALQGWLEGRFGLVPPLLALFMAFRWTMIALALLLGFALIYYLGPDVKQKFKFVTPGSVMGSILIIAASLGFKVYATNFADYNATYGSIGAVIILMLWLYITGLVILLGSEINALLEHYAPEGKVKGEKSEGECEVPSGGPATPPPAPRTQAGCRTSDGSRSAGV